MDFYNFAFLFFAYLLPLSKPLYSSVAENINLLLYLLDLCPLDLVAGSGLRHWTQWMDLQRTEGSSGLLASQSWYLMLPFVWKFSWVVCRSNHIWLILVAWVLNDLSVQFCKGMSQEQKFQDTETSYDPDGSYPVSPTTFCWSKQFTGSEQIQKEMKQTLSSNRSVAFNCGLI